MILLKKTIFLFINSVLLFSCSSEKKEKEESKEDKKRIDYNIHIGDSYDEIKQDLTIQGFKENNEILEKTDEHLHYSVELVGKDEVISWKLSWDGDSEDIEKLAKRLLNVLKTDYPDLKGENNYYACRYIEDGEHMILELIIWEEKIELSHRLSH